MGRDPESGLCPKGASFSCTAQQGASEVKCFWDMLTALGSTVCAFGRMGTEHLRCCRAACMVGGKVNSAPGWQSLAAQTLHRQHTLACA